MPRSLFVLFALAALALAGCGAEPPVAARTPAKDAAPDKPTSFDPSACGKITGSVTWKGTIPAVSPVIDSRPRPDGTGHETRTLTHPYAPKIDTFTYAMQGAVVYLRGVAPERAKPWDFPPASVEVRDAQIVIQQGARAGRVGFVRRGEAVTMQSREPVHHVLRGRGAAFFALPFPDPDKPLDRAFESYGRVELSSAAGYSWHAADLFVCDHPYYTVSGPDGGFTFNQVPEGTYDIVVWHPNWAVTARERNVETGLVQRLVYAPPLEDVRKVMVLPGRVVLANANLALPK